MTSPPGQGNPATILGYLLNILVKNQNCVCGLLPSVFSTAHPYCCGPFGISILQGC